MKKLMFKSSIVTMLCVLCSLSASAEGKFVLFKYGNFDTWVTRQIHESAVIGGNTKTLYEIGPNRALKGNNPYVNLGGSPWGTSQEIASGGAI